MAVNSTMTLLTAASRAYRLLGNLEPPWTPDDDQITQAILAANMMQRAWESDGINLWRQSRITLPVNAAQQDVSITPYVMGVEQVSWQVTPPPNTYNRPLGYYSYVDFYNLPNIDAQSSSGPSIYCFDKQDTTSTLHLWPVPAAAGTLVATVGRSVTDIASESDTLDIPGEWQEAFVYNLADRLMDDQAVASADPATAQHIQEHAMALYAKMLAFDRPTSVFVRPWGTAGRSRIWR